MTANTVLGPAGAIPNYSIPFNGTFAPFWLEVWLGIQGVGKQSGVNAMRTLKAMSHPSV